MNDPHVETLRYYLRSDESISYKEDTPPVVYETSAFKATLVNNVLTIIMKEHFATPSEAISRVQQHILLWEVLTGVQLGLGELRFEYEGADVIDRIPPPPGHYVLTAETGRFTLTGGEVVLSVTRNQYPPPPTSFNADPNVISLWNRYNRFRQGGEPITGMGYFCLSVLQADARGRRNAATKFAIHQDILDELGRLTSEAGDEQEARKLDVGSTYVSLTDNQRTWIDAAVGKLILRVGQYAANPRARLPEITMVDLPAL